MNRSTLMSLGFVAGLAAVSSNAHAYLGGFENADGYLNFLNMVQNYNAGHYGPNSGYGGAANAITPNTDFWTAVQGGFFSGGSVSYTTGHGGYDRVFVNSNGVSGSSQDQGLVATTGHQGWGGPALQYTYDYDAPDFGGVNPATTGGSIVDISFWWRTHLAGAEVMGGVPENAYGNRIQFKDSANNVGLEVGITQHVTGDRVTLWNGATLFETTLAAPAFKYDRWDIKIDVANDTFSADYYQFLTNTTTTLATNQPLMAALGDLTSMDLQTSPGIQNDKGHGLNLDDFNVSVQVPEPSSIGALAVAAAAVLMRRRRRA
jgi:hypothetical protein